MLQMGPASNASPLQSVKPQIDIWVILMQAFWPVKFITLWQMCMHETYNCHNANVISYYNNKS